MYFYVIIRFFEISAIFLQNWNISSSDTLKPKNVLTIDISKPSVLFLKISTNDNINEIVF